MATQHHAAHGLRATLAAIVMSFLIAWMQSPAITATASILAVTFAMARSSFDSVHGGGPTANPPRTSFDTFHRSSGYSYRMTTVAS